MLRGINETRQYKKYYILKNTVNNANLDIEYKNSTTKLNLRDEKN